MKRRQKIQKNITELNQMLRQHQIEQRKQKQEKQDTEQEDALGGNHQKQKTSNQPGMSGISTTSMETIISSEVSLHQVKAQSTVKTSLDGRVGVLRAEINRDAAAGKNTVAKENELSDIEKKSNDVTKKQMTTLSEVIKENNSSKQDEKEDDEDEQDTTTKVGDAVVVELSKEGKAALKKNKKEEE